VFKKTSGLSRIGLDIVLLCIISSFFPSLYSTISGVSAIYLFFFHYYCFFHNTTLFLFTIYIFVGLPTIVFVDHFQFNFVVTFVDHFVLFLIRNLKWRSCSIVVRYFKSYLNILVIEGVILLLCNKLSRFGDILDPEKGSHIKIIWVFISFL
jgi:hypothetical protein